MPYNDDNQEMFRLKIKESNERFDFVLLSYEENNNKSERWINQSKADVPIALLRHIALCVTD